MRTQEKIEFINAAQYNISQLLIALQNVLALKTEYVSLGLSALFSDSDFNLLQSSAGITAAEFNLALNTIVALDTYLNTGSPTPYQNLYKIKKSN